MAAVVRLAGLALISLEIACLPALPQVGMPFYSTVVAIYLAFLGIIGGASGPLLWSAVALHLVLSLLLALGSVGRTPHLRPETQPSCETLESWLLGFGELSIP